MLSHSGHYDAIHPATIKVCFAIAQTIITDLMTSQNLTSLLSVTAIGNSLNHIAGFNHYSSNSRMIQGDFNVVWCKNGRPAADFSGHERRVFWVKELLGHNILQMLTFIARKLIHRLDEIISSL